MKSSSSERRTYFCEEPWTGGFAVQTNLDVKFCPCYLNLKIGSLRESSIGEIWNSPEMRQIRHSFRNGDLPRVCEGQLCPVALGQGPQPLVGIARRARRAVRWHSRAAPALRGLMRRLGGLLRR